ncbi:MAG: hypothetical protein LBS05_00145 [Tannerellaceae bacterium]|jgi:hypothetical protein|nr:hypothetical protein [Tannerellaceae bacterium]
MATKKKKVSQLPEALSLVGLWILGVDNDNDSVKASMHLLKGLNVELRLTGTAIQWRQEGGVWADLISIAALQKPAADAADALAQYLQATDAEIDELIENTNAARTAANAAATAATNAANAATTAKNAADTAAAAATGAATGANTARDAARDAATAATNAANAATTAKNAADAAAAAATAAANAAITAKNAAATAAAAAIAAANAATTAKNAADTAAAAATAAANAATTAKNAADTAAAAATAAATAATNAATTATTAAAAANAAAAKATEISNNPPKIEGGTWWLYNLTTHAYVNSTLPARGPQGKGPIVLANGNFGNWSDATNQYEDSGVDAAATIDLVNVPVAFAKAGSRTLPATGDSVPTVFGKMLRWLSDLKALAFKDKVSYTTDIDNLPRLGQVIHNLKNETTAAGTAAKVLTVPAGYTLTTNDLVRVTWTIANTASTPTFSVSGTVYPVWFNGAVLGQANQYSNIIAGSEILYLFDGAKFHQIGSNFRSQADATAIATTVGLTMGEAIPANRIIMEGADNKFYSLVTEPTSTTAATKPVATAAFKLGGMIYWRNAASAIGAQNPTVFNIFSFSTAWYDYALNGSGHLAVTRMCYLKGTVNAAGNFVLDNSSYTSFYTTTIPTTDDGFVYIELGWVGSTTVRFYLGDVHRAFWFKDGKFRPYGERDLKALALKEKVNYTTDVDNLPRLGQVVYQAENKTTAEGTAAKVLTVTPADYTPTNGDILCVKWTIRNTVANPTFTIGSTNYPVWFAGTTLSPGEQYSILVNTVAYYHFDGTRFHAVGSNFRTQNWFMQFAVDMGLTTGEAMFPNRFIMQGADDKYYSLVTLGSSSTAATKPAATVEFKLHGRIFYNTNTIASPTVGSTAAYYVAIRLTGNWQTYGLNGSGHLGANRMCYLKGTVNAAGNFVLDNSSYTSFYTTTVPTTDDGFVYIEFIWIGSANTRVELLINHRAFWFKDGKFSLYGAYGSGGGGGIGDMDGGNAFSVYGGSLSIDGGTL